MVRVLLVDDMPAVRGVLRAFLTKRNDRFTLAGEAADGLEALQTVATCAPDLIIMDHSMRFYSGLDTIRTLRALGYLTPVIMCSGDLAIATSDLPSRVFSLRKPFSFERLESLMDLAVANGSSASPQ